MLNLLHPKKNMYSYKCCTSRLSAQWLSNPLNIYMASCPHTVDEWVYCPAARLSLSSAIQVGNWVLIECFLREEKQHKQMKTKQNIGRLLNIQQIPHLSENDCQCPSWGFVWLSGQSRYDRLRVCCYYSVSLSFSAISLLLLRPLCPHPFLHIFLLSIYYPSLYSSLQFSLFQFLFLKCPSVTWFSQPQLFIFLFLSSVSSLLPHCSFLYAGHRSCGWRSTTVRGSKK